MSNTPALAAANVYTDLGGLAELRQQASQDAQAALPEVAQQFEALFLQMLLKSMRQTTMGDPLLPDQGADFYRGLFDHQITLTLARARGIGLADVLVRQLGGRAEKAPKQAIGESVPGPPSSRFGRLHETGWSARQPRPGSPHHEPAFDTPQRFVQSLLPHAKPAAQALGVAPQVLIAQAALETGWGRAMIRHPDGENSFNLFGIKANDRWHGSRVTVPTIEFVDGVMERHQSVFRAYDGLSESFRDYVDLIRNAPRYQQALGNTTDPAAYIQSLQAGGYATDPRYAEKVLAVMDSPALSVLKLSTVSSLD
jgi:flagellar protein FlgJ